MGLEIPGCFKALGPWFAWVWRCLHRRWEIRLWLQNPGRGSVQTPPSPPFPPGNQSRTAGRTLTLLNVFPGSAAPWRSLRVNGWNQHFPSAPWSSWIPWPKKKRVRLFQRHLCYVLFYSSSRISPPEQLWLQTKAFTHPSLGALDG